MCVDLLFSGSWLKIQIITPASFLCERKLWRSRINVRVLTSRGTCYLEYYWVTHIVSNYFFSRCYTWGIVLGRFYGWHTQVNKTLPGPWGFIRMLLKGGSRIVPGLWVVLTIFTMTKKEVSSKHAEMCTARNIMCIESNSQNSVFHYTSYLCFIFYKFNV
jgi:hypothetical protein